MSSRLIDKAREGFLEGAFDFVGGLIKAMLVDVQMPDVAIRPVTGATNASPIVVTSAGHGFANGDTVIVGGIVGNLAANGTWTIANVTTDTFALQTCEGLTSTGSGAYASGGYAVNLTVGDMLDDYDAGRVGTDVTLSSKTNVLGVADAADATFAAVVGNPVAGILLYESSGVPSTSRAILWIDGKVRVVCAATALAGATSLPVARLEAGIPSGATLVFSNGASATLSAAATAGDRSLTVSALAANVTAGATADVTHTGANLPVTPNGGSITAAWDNGSNRIFRI